MPDPGTRNLSGKLPVYLVILALACVLVLQQRKERRLRSALALYQDLSQKKVEVKLHNPAPNLDWPDKTPLAEVIEMIKLATMVGPPAFPLGVPVAIDFVGLEAAGQSASSPVGRPSADPGLSLGRKLETVLRPLGLALQIKDATILITSERMVDEPFVDFDVAEP